MPKFKYTVTFSDGKEEVFENTFNNSDEVLEEVLNNFKGDWEQREDGFGHLHWTNETLPISIRIVDVHKDDIRAKKVSEQFRDTFKLSKLHNGDIK